VSKRRSILLVRTGPGGGSGGALGPLGTLAEVLGAGGRFNIAPDGSGPEGVGLVPGMVVLHGPGCVLEVPGGADPRAEVLQVMVNVTDADFAWPVLIGLCRDRKWTMVDPDTGRTFNSPG
jgi:hypothetical protein